MISNDLSFAARTLRNNPPLPVTAIRTLGPGIVLGRNVSARAGIAPPPLPAAAAGQPAPPPNPANQLPLMAVLSHSFWQRQFGGDSAVIGKTIKLFNGPATVVGVASPDL